MRADDADPADRRRAWWARELLRRLDVVALRLRTAADVLSDASVKRSQ